MQFYYINVNTGAHGPVEAENFQDYYRLIGCRLIDYATRSIGNKYYNFYFDDEALLKPDYMFSAISSSVKRIFVGNLLIFGIKDTSLTDEDMEIISSHIVEIPASDCEHYGKIMLVGCEY